ncbi:Glycosyltransferase involved in cell wall bisynthesis [Butyrivibrio proteoclasticus]|uniref:Glycosyltransferase involved in cell wall bisynthesis n=1 Tax=Butyrivibrio proteoclasticus TaxID=43305 RepID=A0A1I5TAY9_9FIRM|nr:glycosyltransferase [Butyrivibrio proteoclasticus]SFP80190.1 Glycosyltransferase involved in cell wall bisynthesis [Butyrivibrio proteoclasticus]
MEKKPVISAVHDYYNCDEQQCKGESAKKVMVSVVVAIYNMENYLEHCIESVLQQTYTNYEVLLVNDGSTDSSEAIIDKYRKKYPTKLKKICKQNGGLSSARNAALKQVEGKYLTFLDADDYYSNDYLERLVNEAEQKNLDVLCSGQYKVTKTGKIVNTIKFKVINGKCSRLRLNISGKLYKTDYILQKGIFFPEGKTYEDNSFNLQAIFLTDRVGFLEYEGYFQLVHEGSITSKRIDPDSLPFDEWNDVAKRIAQARVIGVDTDLFFFTFISFLTYFLLVRNRKREYLDNKENNCNFEALDKITSNIESIVNANCHGYLRNKYIGLFSHKEIPIWQKIGTVVFYLFCTGKCLNQLVKLTYIILR